MKNLLFVCLVFAMACHQEESKKVSMEDKELLKEALDAFAPLPDSMIDQQQKKDLISLGKKLYFEKKLSINGTISCNSCHQLDRFGVDNEATSPGHNKKRGDRNSPTVYNAALNSSQFWDGRAKDLEEQALGPLLNPIEHGLKSEKDAVKVISSKEYVDLFKQAFPGEDKPNQFKNIGVAIAAFEKTLLTPSRFDDFLKGQYDALNTQEKKGLSKFMAVGCTACHSGVGIGGQEFMKLGLVEAYPTKDVGRFKITKDPEDKMVFKVPSLRNIEKTGPYLHDGSVESLDQMIKIMAKHQIGEELGAEDISNIKAFLKTLTAKELPQFSKQ